MSLESFFQKDDWSPRLGARMQDFGSALQGQQGGNLQRYNQNVERDARKEKIAGLMENMGISGNRRAILGMLPVDAQATNLYDMLGQREAASAQASREAAFNAWMQGGQQGPTSTQAPSGPLPPGGFPQSIVDAVHGTDVGNYNAGLSTTESGGNYGIVNSEGYGGRYQFGQDRLTDYNRATGQNVTMDQFLASSQIQEAAQRWNVADTDQFIQSNDLSQYIGQTINGVQITQNGLRAMAHLGGNNGMRKFLESGGTYNPADSNGTRLSDYAATHAVGQPSQPPAQGSGPRMDPELAHAIAFANDASLPPEQRAIAAAMVDQMTSEGTGKQQEYEQYVQQTRAEGGEPMGILEYQQALRSSGATNLTVNSGSNGVDYGTPDKGYMWGRNPDGSLKLEEYTDSQGRSFSRPIQIPKAGGNIEADVQQAASERTAEQQTAVDTASRAIRAIDGAIGLVDDGFATTGVMSAVTGLIPGSDRTDLLAKIQQLQAITGIESLAALRAAGGTTGSLTEKEFERFASAIANFNPDQSAGALNEELRYLRSTFQKLIDDASANTTAPQSLGVGDTTTFNGMTIERVE